MSRYFAVLGEVFKEIVLLRDLGMKLEVVDCLLLLSSRNETIVLIAFGGLLPLEIENDVIAVTSGCPFSTGRKHSLNYKMIVACSYKVEIMI